ncbi:MAG: nuclear transport factor 2 family protein [Candidatus Kariarchaeaceae archaeon]|jgi:hypothetical protein
MENNKLREIVNEYLLAFQSKDIGKLEEFIHPDFYLDPDRSYYGQGWDPEELRKMKKEGFIQYLKKALPWQSFKFNHYDILIEGNEAMCFINSAWTVHEHYHEFFQRKIDAYGPVEYNMAHFFKFKENRIISSYVIQDMHVFLLGVGELLENQEDLKKLKDYIRMVKDDKSIF